MGRRRRKSGLEQIFELILTILIGLIRLIVRILSLLYDVITIYTSKYKVKSGNGFFKTYFNKGNYGEFVLYREIIKTFGKENVFTNVYLENENTDNTEIDVIALSDHGVYVFEMKNYSGYIYGSQNDQYWTQVLNKFSKNKFYNPIRQNYAHYNAVKKYLELEDVEIIPVVVFSNHSKLSKINVSPSHVIIQYRHLNSYIKNKIKDKTIDISENRMKEYSIKLIERSNMPQAIKDKHIEQVAKLQK